ncbi:incA protein domain-containing protein [Purpureocillium lilacinum]|uniref:IncA protein domain-containing protein n=1 Tax=Purpureocillium lilacinum TaxID=33203 RepID=A0A179HJD1_PURLI|nr:incA protein domain-containing protein [Purpureocillium lilacinum]OAQ89691.1 incA protein domain-containing protein [Purpureocillium lilacinum]
MTTPYPESPATMPAHNRDNARILREILQPNWSRLSSNDQRIAAEQVLLCLNSALLQYPSNYSSISAYRNGKLQGLPFPRARWLVLAIWLGEAALKNYDKRLAKKWRYAPWADMVPVKCPMTHLSKSEYNASRRCTAITQTPKDTRQQAASNAQVATEAAYEQVLTQAVSKPARGAPFAEKDGYDGGEDAIEEENDEGRVEDDNGGAYGEIFYYHGDDDDSDYVDSEYDPGEDNSGKTNGGKDDDDEGQNAEKAVASAASDCASDRPVPSSNDLTGADTREVEQTDDQNHDDNGRPMNLEALEIDVDRDATSSSDDLDDQDDDSVPDGDPYWKKVAIRRKKRLYKVNDGDAGAAKRTENLRLRYRRYKEAWKKKNDEVAIFLRHSIKLETHNSELYEQLEEAGDRESLMQETIREQAEQLAAMQGRIDDIARSNASLEEQLTLQSNAGEFLRSQIEEKNDIIRRLRDDVARLATRSVTGRRDMAVGTDQSGATGKTEAGTMDSADTDTRGDTDGKRDDALLAARAEIAWEDKITLEQTFKQVASQLITELKDSLSTCSSCTEKSEQLLDLHRKLQAANEVLDERAKTVADTQGKLNAKDAQIDELRQKLDHTQQHAAQLPGISDLLEQFAHVKAELSERAAVEAERVAAKKRADALAERLWVEKHGRSKAEGQVRSLKHKLGNESDKPAQAQHQVNELPKTRLEMEQEECGSFSKVGELEKQLREQKRARAVLEARVGELEEQLRRTKESQAAAEDKVKTAPDDLDQYRTRSEKASE